MAHDPSQPAPSSPELEPFTALAHAWRAVLADPGRVLGGSAALVLAGALGAWLTERLSGTSVLAWVVWSVVLLAFWQALAAVLVRACLDVLDGRRFDVVDAARRIPWPDIVVTALVVSAMTTVGVVLCVVPGVVVAVLTGFSTYVVVEEGAGPVDAVRRSAVLVRRHAGDVVTLMLLTIGVVLAGLLVACVGLVVALPLVYLSWGFAYRWFHGRPARQWQPPA